MEQNYSAYYEAILVEEAHIRDLTFKITIPSLFNTREDKETGVETINRVIDTNAILNNKDLDANKQFQSTTILEAVNHTDYTFQYRGDTFVMEKSKFNTFKNLRDQGGIIIIPVGPNTPHYHEGADPIKMWNYNYENLNDVKVPKGTKCYGFFINGIPKTFAVTRIEGAIPLNKSQIPKYEK